MSFIRANIKAVADPLIAAGATNEEVRAAVLKELCIGIGGGAAGTATGDGSELIICAYCGQSGNGGHGGMCPETLA